jgi:hypothetical protein
MQLDPRQNRTEAVRVALAKGEVADPRQDLLDRWIQPVHLEQI